jgi:hypothetical protein
LAEDAYKIISRRVSDINEIEEYELDDIPSHGKRWEVEIDMATGEIISETEEDDTVWSSEDIPKSDFIEPKYTKRWNPPRPEGAIRAISTRGRDVAYKAALDKRNQVQAEREGIA